MTAMSPELKELLEYFTDDELDELRHAMKEAVDLQKADKDPQQIREIPPIEEWVQSRYYLGPFQTQLFDYWRHQIPDFVKNKHTEWVITGCFVGSTKIPLLDGTEDTLANLAERFPAHEDSFWVYSATPEGDIVPGRARHVRKTGEQQEVWAVTLDNGAVEHCTPDHLWLLRDGTYKRADALTPDDALMPLYRAKTSQGSYDKYTPDGYERLYIPSHNAWVCTHRVVGHRYHDLPLVGGIGNNRVLHHESGKEDNRPEQLRVMDRHAHIWLHRKMNKTRWRDPSYRQKQKESRARASEEGRYSAPGAACRAAQRAFMRTPEGRKLALRNLAKAAPDFSDPEFRRKHQEGNRRSWEQASEERRKKAAQRMAALNRSGSLQKRKGELHRQQLGLSLESLLEKMATCTSILQVAEHFNCTSKVITGMLSRAGLPTKRAALQERGLMGKNHRVVSVTFSHFEDVYDLEVDEYHNFALSSGVFVHNSIGGGKSTAAALTSLYKLTELSCYRYPQRLFHLADISKIVFAYLSITLKQADMTGFDKIREMIDASPYFNECYPRDPRSNRILRWANNVMFIPGSSALSVIGVDLLVLLFDEANFTKQGGGKPGDLAKAQEIYHETTDRRRSRFLYHGVDPGYSLLISSSTHQSSFTSSRIKNATEDTKVTIARVWDTKPGSYDLTKWFYCFVGTEKEEPFIVEQAVDLLPVLSARPALSHVQRAIERDLNIDPMLVLDNLPTHAKKLFEKIPLEFKDRFESNIYQALKNIAGLSITPSGKLFTNEISWRGNINSDLVHPFTAPVVTVSIRNHERLKDFLLPDSLFDMKAQQCLRHPEARRYLHFDQSATGCHSGIACVHRAGFEADEKTLARVPIVEVDFVLYIKPPPAPDRISLAKLRELTFDLQEWGMPIGGVTLDGWQSEDALQIYLTNGIPASILSVDISDKQYLMLVDLLYGGRCQMAPNERLKREIFNLDWDEVKGKVYKPSKNVDGSDGSKDGSDALAGAVWACLHADDRAIQAERRAAEIQDAELHYPKEEKEDRDSWIFPPGYKGFLEE